MEKDKPQIRLLYCIPHLYNAGGMERVLTQKVNALCEMGYAITIVTTEKTPAGVSDTYFPLHESVKVLSLNIDFDADFHAPLLQKYFAHHRRQKAYKHHLLQIINTEKTDICISLCGKELEWLYTIQTDHPCHRIAEIHFALDQRAQVLQTYHKGCFWNILGKIRVRQMIRQAKQLERFIVLTDADLQRWRKAGCTNALRIYNPICVAHTHTVDVEKKQQVLAVGRLHPQKGYDIMLHVWKQVSPQFPAWNLRIVGEGEERANLEALIQQLGIGQSVALAGLAHDVAAEYESSRILLQTSRYEGLPLVLLEAMSFALPCIAFSCPEGPAEILKHNQTGILVEANNTTAMAKQLAALMHNEAQQQALGKAAQLDVQQRFSPKQIMGQWDNLFKELCK